MRTLVGQAVSLGLAQLHDWQNSQGQQAWWPCEERQQKRVHPFLATLLQTVTESRMQCR